MKDIFFFNSMLTPKIITGVYWLLLLGVFIAGIGAMVASNILYGIGFWVIGAVAVRIYCELAIVLFKINDHARAIADASGATPAASAGADAAQAPYA